jgi:hypothetical protein
MRTIFLTSIIMLALISSNTKVFAQQNMTSAANMTAPSGIDWNILCNDISQMSILFQSCSDLVNQNGTLTSAGETAMGCIKNGLSLGFEALHHGVPLGRVIFGLGLLAQPTGCGSVVNMNAVESANQFQFLAQAFSLH